MANELTGDFDVVAQFAMPAVNRLLAGMHRVERFPHSLAMRVEDVAPRGPHFETPTVSTVSDGYGEAVANHQRIGRPVFSGDVLLDDSGSSRWRDPLVNIGIADILIDPIVPSLLKGHAQAQLFPPTVEVADAAASRLSVKMEMMCRYLPDPGTPPVAEFVRGVINITAPVSQVATQAANVVNIDVRAANATVSFTPLWSSTPITAEDRAGIDQLMRNALRTSFLPSNIVLPSTIGQMKFKAMPGPQPAIAALIDSEGSGGNPATATNQFLSSGDDFAFAASEEYITAAFQPAIDAILNTPVEPFSFSVNLLLTTYTVTYQVTLTSAEVKLQQGRILLTIKGRARTGSAVAPNFDFTVTQPFTLVVDGASADLEVGELSVDTSSWIADRFRGGAVSRISRVRDRALAQSGARAEVARLLDADQRLGGFFRSLLEPARGRPIPFGKPYSLAYTSVDIRPAGIVLHGSISLRPWPVPVVSFEEIPVNNGPLSGLGSAVTGGPDFSALKSWIPGGTIDSYEWGYLGGGISATEQNRFVHRKSAVSDSVMARTLTVGGYSPLCLTVRGTRLTASGAVTKESVTASRCLFSSFPLLDMLSAQDGNLPSIALAAPGDRGNVRVKGYMRARVDQTGSAAPNLMIHFAGESGVADPEELATALLASGRADAATAIIIVARPGELERTKFTPGIVYADDSDGAWSRRYEVASTKGPATIVVDPKGRIVGRHEGPVEAESLATMLRSALATRRVVAPRLDGPRTRVGTIAPNFLVGQGDGRDVTLRKLSGRDATLVFFSTRSPASVAFAREEIAAARKRGELAIGIVDSPDADRSGDVRDQAGIDAPLVNDTGQRIADAYGIQVSPAVVQVDAAGAIRSVRNGFETSGDRAPAQRSI